ncbi:MAG: glycosyltransferase [Pseudoclavibacter sp.]
MTEVWEPQVNGVVTRLASTVDELAAAGHEVLVVAPRVARGRRPVPRRQRANVRGARVATIRFPFVYGGEPWGLPSPATMRAIRRFDPDLVHVVNPVLLGIEGVRAARRLDKPLVASFHTDVAAYARSYSLTWIVPTFWALLRRIDSHTALHLVTSQHSQRLLAANGIPDAQLWRRAVERHFFEAGERARLARDVVGAAAPDQESPAASPRSTTPPVAICVGRLADEKGLTRLVPLARTGSVRLVFVGDGPDRERLEAAFAGTGTEFRGTLRGDALAEAYREADVFVFPSRTETLGLVMLESLATGTPVVAIESPASIELLSGSPAGRLVRADDVAMADRAAAAESTGLATSVVAAAPTEPGPGVDAGADAESAKHTEPFAAAVADLLDSATRAELAESARAEVAGYDWKAATAELIERYRVVVEGA